MFVDARTVRDGTRIRSGICIVGGGAAGITLARELADGPQDVCLLESGGFDYEGETQDLYDGDIVGHPYYNLMAARLRYFGGTTNHWGGWCRPLDAIDFEARDGLPLHGWPFDLEHLHPFYRRAHQVCQLGPYDYDIELWSDESPTLPFREAVLRSEAMLRSPPTRFGQVYRDLIEQSTAVTAYLHANAVEIVVDADGGTVASVRVATIEGGEFQVEARVFVLATGAIENARLLLASNRVHTAGLGNRHDLVGRHFMEHLLVPGALFVPSDPDLSLDFYRNPLAEGVPGHGVIAVAPEVLRSEELLNVRLLLMPGTPEELAMKDSDGISSAAMVWNALLRGRAPGNLSRHVRNILGDLDGIAMYSYRRAYRPPGTNVAVQVWVEQAPNPDSRVSLTRERDVLGLPRVQLDWRFGELERRALGRACELFALQVGEARLGRVRIAENEEGADWPAGVRGGWHHMGTTRMSLDPRQGVVDADCRVHGLSNLYVAGSSVFPTSGTHNPTLTIVALTLRLADHIGGRFT